MVPVDLLLDVDEAGQCLRSDLAAGVSANPRILGLGLPVRPRSQPIALFSDQLAVLHRTFVVLALHLPVLNEDVDRRQHSADIVELAVLEWFTIDRLQSESSTILDFVDVFAPIIFSDALKAQ